MRIPHLRLALLAAALVACAPKTPSLPLDGPLPRDRVVAGVYTAAAPNAPPITLASLAANEQFWPHQIRLVEEWKPAGWEGEFGWGMGVLIEVDVDARLRVDFARFGKYWLPARVTDVVDRANAIRRGEAVKFAPNLVLALGNRLLDPTGRTLRESDVDLLAQRAFVLVYADPRSADFPEIAEALVPFEALSAVHLVLMPQGGHPDFHVWKAAHEGGWRGSFLLDRFAPAYTEGFRDTPPTRPVVEIRSPEGRRLWQGPARATPEMLRVFGL